MDDDEGERSSLEGEEIGNDGDEECFGGEMLIELTVCDLERGEEAEEDDVCSGNDDGDDDVELGGFSLLVGGGLEGEEEVKGVDGVEGEGEVEVEVATCILRLALASI